MSKAARKTPTSTETIEKGDAHGESAQDIMQAVLSKPSNVGKSEESKNNRINGVVIGSLSGFGENGQPLVHYPGIPLDEPVPAVSTEDLSGQSPGHEVALGFVNGNPALPIILGLIQKAGIPENAEVVVVKKDAELDVKLDGEKLTLSADKEIVLKCGKSSITLTRAGKVIIKGAYLSNHSTGVNRIKGGSVQIN